MTYSNGWHLKKNTQTEKNTCFAICVRVGTKFLNLSHHISSMDDCLRCGLIKNWGLAWWCDFFPVGANLWRSTAKKVRPLRFYFWHLRLDLFKSLFCRWSWAFVIVSCCKEKCIFSVINILRWQILLVTTFGMSELEQEGKKNSAAGDLIVPIRIDRCGATSFQTNPNPGTFVHNTGPDFFSDVWPM